MYEKILEIKTQETCNYSINISPLDSSIFFSLDDTSFLIPKENFLSLSKYEDLKTIQIENKFPSYTAEDTIATSKFTEDGKKIFIGDVTKTLNKLDLNSDNKNFIKNNIEIKNLKTFKFDIDSNGNNLITGCSNLILYDVINNKIIKEIENRSKFIYSFCFLPNNKCAIGNSYGCVYFFDTQKQEQINKIEEHCLLVRNLCFNENKNILYSASDDLHINQIDINKFRCYSPIIGHKEPVSSMIYNKNKNLLFTSSFDGTIKIWDDNGVCLDTLEKDSRVPLWDIGLSKDADFLAFSSNEGIGVYLKK